MRIMNVRPRRIITALLVLATFAALAAPALAAQDNKGTAIAKGLEKEVSGFFGILKVALGLLVVIGLMAGGAVAMTRGDWGRGLMTIGFAVLLIITFFVVSGHLGIGEGGTGASSGSGN